MVIGSQAILGQFPNAPAELLATAEVPDAVRALVAAHRDHGQAQSTVPDSV